jgi:hypothetical protein
MKKADTKITQQLQAAHLFWSGLHSCFAVFAAIFFFANVSVQANIPLIERSLDSHFCNAAEAALIVSELPAGHQPVGINTFLSECEIVDQFNPENEFDNDGLDGLSAVLPTGVKFNLHSNNSLYLQLKLASECRETISLFVLHHSWKSSIC